MSMNGIDISSWQTGIDLTKVPCDFVIIKATQGTSYVNPDCSRAYKQAKSAGKCLGVYHYATGRNAVSEADYFIKNVKSYLQEAILALDWESDQNSQYGTNDATWVKTFLDRVYSQTGVRPLLYVSKSISSKFAKLSDYGLWIAQYANNNSTGYQDKPWNEGTYSCVIRQYSSHGSLSGYSGNLDLNKFYGDKSTWNSYAGKGNTTQPTTSTTTTTSTGKITVDGLWGTETTKKAQKVFGTTVDGIISNQPSSNKTYLPNAQTTSWQFKSSGYSKGSQLVRAIQKKIGATQDGFFGKKSVIALQKFLGVTQDGKMGSVTVTTFQTWLNKQ